MSPRDQAPSVSAIIPTLDSKRTLAALLRSLRAQRYSGELEILCVDGGSVDSSKEIARRYDARVIANDAGEIEEARAIGVELATGDLVLMLDPENELPHTAWLKRLVEALYVADDIVSADCLFHGWRRSDPPFTRFCGLIGGADPVAIELGYADRWGSHLQRWTGMPVKTEEHGDVLVARIDPSRPPAMGANGFLVRREEVLRTAYKPYVHCDVVGDLAELGWRFARVRDSIIRHEAADLSHYVRNARARARRVAQGVPVQRRGFRPPIAETVRLALASLLLIAPAARAVRGYKARPDRAWALYPVAAAVQTAAYVTELARAMLKRGHQHAAPARLGRGSEPRLGDYPGLVSVVMPTYNEAGHLASHVAETLDALDKLGCRHELIIVDDGSGDDTRTVAREAAAADHRVAVVSTDENNGKGFALIHGARAARGELVLFVDADLEVHPRQLSILYETLVRSRSDVVIGSKLHPRSRVAYPLKRRILSLGYYALVRTMFGLPVRDTQTGLKLYKREVLDRVLPRLVVKRYAHDLEALVNVQRLGYRISEAPVVVTRERDFDRIGRRDAIDVMRDTLAIWYRTYILHYYDRHVEASATVVDTYRARGAELIPARPAIPGEEGIRGALERVA